MVCNRILPPDTGDGFFSGWIEAQKRYLNLVSESFDPIPILKAPLMPCEVVGLDPLRALGEHIFCGQDPTGLFYQGRTQEITKVAGRHVLSFTLPFASKADISVVESRDELIVQVGHYRRNIILPRALAGLGVEEAKMDGNTLQVIFRRG